MRRWTPRMAEALIGLQIRLEYALDASGYLVPFPGSTEQARFIVHRHVAGYLHYFRHDVAPQVREQLRALPGEEALTNQAAVKAILEREAPCHDVFMGHASAFVSPPQLATFPDAVYRDGVHVILVDDAPVSWAWSSRENDAAAEGAVETAPDFRRRGYGRQVVAAWAYHVMGQGKVAFYSYASDNLPSRALARSLGVVEFSTVVAYE